MLQHGLAPQPGLVIAERSVNGQAGIMLSRNDEATAAIAVDLVGQLISVVWTRLNPEKLRHRNTV